MSSSPLGRPYDYAVSRLHEAAGRMEMLPIELQTLLLVESAQGIIDNGGLEFFYEADFPNSPPYSVFVEAYRRIGAESAASCIEKTSRMFPFEEPHLFEGLRQLWLGRLRQDPLGEFCRLSDCICGDRSVWDKLGEFVGMHHDAFAVT